jgi:hypothetical protein
MAPFETRNGKFGMRIGIGWAWTAMVVADGEARGQKFRSSDWILEPKTDEITLGAA